MYLLRTDDAGLIKDKHYTRQEEANSEARHLAYKYNKQFYVCKVVDVSVFSPPFSKVSK